MTQTVCDPRNPSQIPIGYRLRRDVAWQSQLDGHSMRPTWIAEDPLTRRIFRCGDGEYRLLHWLDSDATFESIQKQFNKEFAPQTIDLQQVQALIAKCNQGGMLRTIKTSHFTTNKPVEIWPQSSVPIVGFSKWPPSMDGQSQVRETNWVLMLIRWLSSAIGKLTQMQVSLGSPDRWLVHIAPRLGWLYSGVAVCFWLGLLGVAGVLVCMRFDAFLSEFPDFQSLRSPAILVGYGTIFLCTRLFHEFGHAVVCQRAGASCKDAGIIVSFGMLCPYVDITEAWKTGSRLARMGIALAGIYSECVLAFLAAIVWLTTHPGWAHDVALQTLLVCTVTTLLFNANPLMKYDGYFVLCDWLNTQNLREKSFESIDAVLDGRARRESMGMSFFLGLYFVGSTINRVALIAGLVSMVYFIASQWQLAGLGLGLMVLYGCCTAITTMAAWTLSLDIRARHRAIGRRAAWLGWTAVSLLIAWAVNMPLPNRTYSNGIFRLGDRQPVYTSLPGRIDRAMDATEGKSIERETMILTITNAALQKNVYDLETRLMRIDSQLGTLDRTAYFDNRSIASVPMLISQRELVTKQLEQKWDDQSRLIVSAPVAGWFEPAKAKQVDAPENPSDVAFGLGTTNVDAMASYWISDSSIGRLIDRGTLIGWIVQDQNAKIECRLTEEQIYGIDTATEVRVCMAQDPTTIFAGRVVEVARMSMVEERRNKNPTQSQELSPMTYQVRIALTNDPACPLYTDGNAEVVFIKPSQSILNMAMDHWMRDSKMR